MPRLVIDGERKALVKRVADGFLFVGLLRRSEWESRGPVKGEMLVTQRALMGATLHVESLAGQLPIAGQTIIPAALLKGRSGQERSGAAMDAHLYQIKAQRSQERIAFKKLNTIKANIL